MRAFRPSASAVPSLSASIPAEEALPTTVPMPAMGLLLELADTAAATAARLLGGSTWLQLSSAASAGAGIAIAQTLLPAVVKPRFAARAGLVTGYVCAAPAPLLVGALRDTMGDFRLAFALLGGPGLLTLLPIARLRRTTGS